MAQIDKVQLQSYYQNPGDIYSDTKTESVSELIADQHNETDARLTSAIANAVAPGAVDTTKLANRAVTRSKIREGAVGSTELDPALLQNFGDIAVQAKFVKVDAQLADITINVKSFGAISNNSSFDSSDAINAALAAAQNGQSVLIPGKFTIFKPIIVPLKSISLEGTNLRECIIEKGSGFVGEAAVIVAGADASDANRIKYLQLKNFAIEGNNQNGAGLVLRHVNFPIIENVMSIRNNGSGVYLKDVQDIDAHGLLSIFNGINMEIQGYNTGLDFYKILLKFGKTRNLLVDSDGTLDGVSTSPSNITDRLTFWGGLIEGDSATSAPAAGTPLIELKGCSHVTFNEVGTSKGKYPQFTGIKIDKVTIGGTDVPARNIVFNSLVMYSSTPPDAGTGIHVVNAQNTYFYGVTAPGIAVPIRLDADAFETTIGSDSKIDFTAVINNSSTTFEISRNKTGLYAYLSKLILQDRLLQLASSDTTNSRDLYVDLATKQTVFKRNTGVEGGEIEFFRIYTSGIMEPNILRISPNNPASNLAGVVRLQNNYLEVRNETNNGWYTYGKLMTGTTANRPINANVGQTFLDTTVGSYIYYAGSSVWKKIKDDTTA